MSREINPDVLAARTRDLVSLLEGFETKIGTGSLRDHVLRLVPINLMLRELGASTIDASASKSARQRILEYLMMSAGQVVAGDELMVVSGISEYARRVRELRVEEGWPILTGVTAAELRNSESEEAKGTFEEAILPPPMKPDDYLLLKESRDEEGARRWGMANEIRKKHIGVKQKLIEYFRRNVGAQITSEELRYVAGNKTEWARRTRELRTEGGWPIVTRFNGDPKLPSGVYILAEDRQAPAHDRHIQEIVRREVMRRDRWSCRWQGCGWNKDAYDVDPRFLEVHHIEHHVKGGKNEPGNLVTLCNLHHDEVHRTGELKI